MGKTNVTKLKLSHGQIPVPKEFREKLGMFEGQLVHAVVKGNELVISKIDDLVKGKSSTLSAKGKVRVKNSLEEHKKEKVKTFQNADELIKDLTS